MEAADEFASQNTIGIKFMIYKNESSPVLPTLCRTFRPIQKKNSTAQEKNSIPSNFPFLKEFCFKKNTVFVCVSGKITLFLRRFPGIREENRRGKFS
jgi:hypothetical protein